MHDWQEIQQRHGAMVFSTVYRIVKRHDQALDCYQEVFLEAFERCAKRSVRDWPALLRWLAVCRALDRLRKERRAAVRAVAEHLRAKEPGGEEPADRLQFRELVDRVRLELALLPDRQAEAFWLSCVEEMTYAEVAEQLGTDSNAVGVLVHRARARLRELLSDLDPARVKN